MSKPTVNFIGVGKLGASLAKALIDKDIINLNALYIRDINKASKLKDFLKPKNIYTNYDDIAAADITFITCIEEKIERTLSDLIQSQCIKEKSLIVHCSGIKNSAVLNQARQLDCLLASAHPCMSFIQPEKDFKRIKSAPIAIEGDLDAISILKCLFEALGAQTFEIAAQHKILYHCACVMANNYQTALAQATSDLFKTAGLDQQKSKMLCSHLMRNSIENFMFYDNAQDALSGPIQRGDLVTVDNHLLTIEDKKLKSLYLKFAEYLVSNLIHTADLKKQWQGLFAKHGA